MSDYIGPYLAGEQPAAPVVITVDDVTDLSVFDSVDVIGLPQGTYVLNTDPDHLNQIFYTFTAPLEEGRYEAVVSMNGLGGTVDLSTSFIMTVDPSPLPQPPNPNLPENEAVVDPSSVYTITGKHVGTDDITRATNLIATVEGIPLYDDEWFNNLSTSDQHRLETAVAWTSTMPTVDLSTTSTAESASGMSGVIRSASVGDVSVSYGDAGTSSGTDLTMSAYTKLGIHPLAALVLGQLSWKSAKTIYTEPMLTDTYPKVYTDAMAFGPLPVVRGMPTDEMLWNTVHVYRRV